MPYLIVDNFSAGLDSRRHVLNSRDGTLAVLKNAHITRGGEIEKRKAFKEFANLPANTFGLETTQDAIYVFGSIAAPTMPAGITYQRLQHPDGLAMTKVAWSTVYGGKPFVIAQYSDNKRFCFWDGAIVGDWFQGVVRTSMANNSGVASHLASTFSLPGYTCTASGNVLTITGPAARPFTVTGTAESPYSLSINTTTPTVAGDIEVRSSVSIDVVGWSSAPAVSTLKFRAHAIQYLPDINGIYLDGVNMIAGPVNYADAFNDPESANSWCDSIAKAINDNTSASKLAAYAESQTGPSDPNQPGAVFIRNIPDNGSRSQHYYRNGKELWVEFVADPSGATGISQMTVAGTIAASPYNAGMYIAKLRRDPWGDNAPGGNTPNGDSVYSPTFWADVASPPSFSDPPVAATFRGGVAAVINNVTVSGVSILGAGYITNHFVPFGDINALAERINATIAAAPNGTPTKNLGVAAYVEGNKLVIRGNVGTGDTSNGKAIAFTTLVTDNGNGTFNEAAWIADYSPLSGTIYDPSSPVFNFSVSPSSPVMSGGKNGVPAVSQVTTVTINGPFTPGKKISITITDPELADPYIFGASRVADKQPNFSITYKAKEYAAVGSTMYFSALNDAAKWDIYDLGSGFIDMSNNFGGREDLTGFGVYQGQLAVFSRRNVQLWFLDADPGQNQQRQILANTGAIAPDSIVSMGAIDLLYLADNGIRSLRARENTDTAFASDIGSAVDSIVISQLSALTDEQKAAAKAIVEPVDGRYWLVLGNKIYVLSYFPGANISAWSIYEPGIQFTDLASKDDRVYARAGDVIYLYGGAAGDEYDSSQVVVELPYLDGKKPATFKRTKGVDVTIQGEWQIQMGFDHTNPTARDVIATPNQPTFALGKIDAVGIGTHFGLRLVNSSSGYAKLANIIVHFDELQAKHEAG